MNEQEFRKKLSKGTVKFEYRKKDGTVREAIGTTNHEYLKNLEDYVEGKNKIDSSNTVRYYDIEKCGWRSFNFESLISVERDIQFKIKTGWKLNPNLNVVNMISKRCYKNDGECPCYNTIENKEDRMCPCKNYIENDVCCCTLYI